MEQEMWQKNLSLWGGKTLVVETKERLAGKFATENHAGPRDVADFLHLDDEDGIEMTKGDAYEQVA